MNITSFSRFLGPLVFLTLFLSCNLAGNANDKRYPNGFAEIGIKQKDIDAKIEQTVERYFRGTKNERLYYEFGDDMAYMLDVNNNDIRSEGMSYGMMFCVQLGMKEEFDKLWKLSHDLMQNASGDFKGYFAWHLSTDGKVIDANPASDGEEYFAAALFMASNRWGDGEGTFNYRAQANYILDQMLRHRELTGLPEKSAITDIFDANSNQVVFVPFGDSATFTDPSYHVPHFYELFARWAARDNDRWKLIADESRKFFKKACNPETGLAADYTGFDGVPVRMQNHYRFEYDAWRVAMNISLDSLWWNKDTWQRDEWVKDYLGFFRKQGIGYHRSLFDIDGSHAAGSHSTGLASMNAIAALISGKEDHADFIKVLWNTPMPTGRYRYYDGCLYLFALLNVSGNYRIIEAKTK